MPRTHKVLGQHFLMHPATARRIVAAADVTPSDMVLEIGPGRGMLTRALLETGSRVVAVETDGDLTEHLKEAFVTEIAKGRLVLIHDDIRHFEPKRHKLMPGGYKLVANIPYYITGEIIRQFLSSRTKPSSMTLLVQKEVAERIARAKKESILSLSVKAYGTPQYEFTVPKGAFVPAPKVNSAVLTIADITRGAFRTRQEEELFFKIVKTGFAHKRKKLMSNLSSLYPPNAIANAFKKLEIPEQTRAEELTLSTWRALARGLEGK